MESSVISPVTIKRRGKEFVAIDAMGEERGSHPRADVLARNIEERYRAETIIEGRNK